MTTIETRSPFLCSSNVAFPRTTTFAAALPVGALDAGAADNRAAGGEVGTGHRLQERAEPLVAGAVRRSMTAMTPSITSRMLCGGMLVAMPTAMPVDPFTSRFGNGVGRTVGSSVVSSKFGTKSTVSLPRSAIIASASASGRASLYRMAAGGSPSIDPKLPWPSTSG